MKSYKGRKVDLVKPVRVYRNLHRGGYSIKQGRYVVAHATACVISEARFIVNETGRQRVLQEKKKNVHAYVDGMLSKFDAESCRGQQVKYNPYKAGVFKCGRRHVHSADVVAINSSGVFIQ